MAHGQSIAHTRALRYPLTVAREGTETLVQGQTKQAPVAALLRVTGAVATPPT